VDIVELLFDMDGLPVPVLQDKIGVLSLFSILNKSSVKFLKQRVIRIVCEL
jgi:hypothetical protein